MYHANIYATSMADVKEVKSDLYAVAFRIWKSKDNQAFIKALMLKEVE